MTKEPISPGKNLNEGFAEEPGISLQDIVRHTGLGIKLRFLLAMILVALIPVGLLAFSFSHTAQPFFGRNTWLILSGILFLTVLVATGVAFPIVRPIRRATRLINTTTDDVRSLSNSARGIAQDHQLGITILRGASKRFLTRRQSIIRDGDLIVKTCEALRPRLSYLLQQKQLAHDAKEIELLRDLQQGQMQIASLAASIARSLESDNTLDQLNQAMESAQEISSQFEEAGKQLERGAQQLEVAASTLL
ncbi:hypothetical protein EPA93_11365 [Ktedonosporobacter rubrisoli]|uniref:Methyl-accepting chemotaxis protein n=1 Tax=Ktedonosporobacter rubrisoli TaxID=2509675 RepID=A0A4P6JMQ6_KTERU|nr:hypothetical protein [Ktedonosporobacter rubrisoli]QBD76567.1 hypothetical protein EPA93_11365 [Ktedonosporobacter rubrisoli]